MDDQSPMMPDMGEISETSFMSPDDSFTHTPAQTPGQTPSYIAATPSTAGTAAGAPVKAPRILACVLCQHRKIKCDRNSPCSNCLKANATCTPSTPAPARKRRRPNQDLQERLARCEELLKTYYASGAPPPPSTEAAASEPATSELRPYPPVSARDFTQTGRVFMADGTTRFTDSVLWSKFFDELSAMRKILEAEDYGTGEDNSLGSETTSPDELTELMMTDYSNMSLRDVQPEPVQMFRLWQIFLDRVNPLTKIVHVPTIQRYIVDAAGYSSTNLPANYQPLVFAIFTVAVYTLSDSEARQMLGMSRDEALKKYSHGVRTALYNVNFMQTYDIPILQGLALYTMSLSGRCDPHSQWVFGGVCLRIAQKMGLHRDGSILGLTPFETEMRRRIWWWVVLHDAGYALMTGMSVNVVPSFWDTKLPSNVNDADLFPGSADPISSREGPTEMGFALISYELGRFMIRSHGMAGFEAAMMGVDPNNGRELNGIDEALVQRYRKWVAEFQKHIESLAEKLIDPTAGPMHEAASLLIKFITHKLNEVLCPPNRDRTNFDFKKNMFRLGIMNLESHLELYSVLERLNFLWFGKSHFSADVMVMVAAQLIQRSEGPMIDRAWVAINKTFRYHTELLDMTKKVNQQLGLFLLRGWSNREASLIKSGEPFKVPECIQDLRSKLPACSSDSSCSDGMTEPPIPPSLSAPLSAMPSAALHHHAQPEPSSTNDFSNPGLMPGGPNALDPSIDQILGGYLDVAQFDWDMWHDGSSNTIQSVNAAAMAGSNVRIPPQGRSVMIGGQHVMLDDIGPAMPGLGNLSPGSGMGMGGNMPDGSQGPGSGQW